MDSLFLCPIQWGQLPRTFEGLIKESKFHHINQWVNAKRFPIRSENCVDKTIAVHNIEDISDSSDALLWATRNKLKIPFYEDVFALAITTPQEERYGKIVFLHEPWLMSGQPMVLCLDFLSTGIHLRLLSRTCRWSTHYRFAFVAR